MKNEQNFSAFILPNSSLLFSAARPALTLCGASGAGMKYHHVGIPTEVEQTGEIYLRDYKLYCTDDQRNPFGIQWMRYESDCPLPELVKTKAHVAFEVDDLAEALKGHEILIEPNSPSEGVLVAFVVCDGAPVEFIQFVDPKRQARAGAG